ncbi:MAG: putative membrane protein YfcA, partial [Thermoproteota archaeon]
GIKSSILGIGGGTITVPFLSWSGLNMKKAVGISAAVGIPIAIFGAGTYMFKGLNNPLLPEYSLGYIYLPAFFGIITTSSIFSKMGTKLSQKIPQDKLYRYFALFILIMLLKTYYSLFN